MKLGFLIDNRTCIGCHACTVACKQEHDVPLGRFRTWVKYIEKGHFPDTRRHFSVMRCNHCERPPCVEICPVTALFKRDNGIVDFDADRCIGCKSCMQACPYDALYIEPESGAAHKCNFCAHRIEIGREPACVTVCPEQAIVAGDLDDPLSRISRLVTTQRTTVRAPEKATRPKLRYIDADPASLVPLDAPPRARYVWSETNPAPLPLNTVTEEEVIRTYDVGHDRPWGWRVTSYLVTKGIASGAFLVSALGWLLLRTSRSPVTLAQGTLLSLFFLLVTSVLLVVDLKRPSRFLQIMLAPQWKSWLVIGAYILSAYGGVLSATLALLWWHCHSTTFLAPILLGGICAFGVPIAAMAAMYTGWLFRQCKARDLWMSAELPWHLLVQAILAGSATMLVLGPNPFFSTLLALALVVDLFWFLPHALHPASRAAREAASLITNGSFRNTFWVGAVLMGHVLPLLLLRLADAAPLAGLLAIIGLAAWEHCFITAGQAIPNS